MGIEIRPDYPLKGELANFEAYMFITTNKFIGQHEQLPETEIMVMDGERSEGYNLQHVRQRKDALHNFNVYITRRMGHYPKAREVSCFILYFDPDNLGEDNDESYLSVYLTIRKMAAEYCKERGVAMAMVPHFHQGDNMPHLHILYQRNGNKDSEFQKYIQEKL